MLRSALLVLVALVTACSVSRPPSDADGEEIYRLLCSNCHAVDLAGTPVAPALGPGSSSASQPDAFIEFAVVNGKGSMPSFDSVLNDDQVGRLVDYMRRVQAG